MLDLSGLDITFEIIAMFLAVCGGVIIVYGAIFAAYHFLLEVLGLAHRGRGLNVDHIRLELSRNIVLGLEFFVGADIIQTIIVPDYYEIGLLGVLIVIRTILSYFLNREIIRLTPPDRSKLR